MSCAYSKIIIKTGARTRTRTRITDYLIDQRTHSLGFIQRPILGHVEYHFNIEMILHCEVTLEEGKKPKREIRENNKQIRIYSGRTKKMSEEEFNNRKNNNKKNKTNITNEQKPKKKVFF